MATHPEGEYAAMQAEKTVHRGIDAGTYFVDFRPKEVRIGAEVFDVMTIEDDQPSGVIVGQGEV